MPKIFKFTVDAVMAGDTAYIVADTREEAQKFIDDTNYADWARKQELISYETEVEKLPVGDTDEEKGKVFFKDELPKFMKRKLREVV